MKNIKILITLLAIVVSASVSAQQATDGHKQGVIHNIFSKMPAVTGGVLVGTDIGGAIPMPMKYIPKTFNPYPQLNIAIGLFGEVVVAPQWHIGVNLIYKTVGMKADARVDAQKYKDGELLQYYTGTADMDMSFTMLEVPLYAKYTFNNQTSSIILGAYYAYNLKSSFSTTATKGYSGGKPGEVDVVIKDNGEPIIMDFSSSLRSWDTGVIVGYEHNFFKRLNAGVRLNIGLVDIFNPGTDYFDYKMLHMRGTIIVKYRLF